MTDSSVGISQAKASASMPKGFASIDWADNEECPVCKKPLGSRDVGVPNCCNHFFCFTCIKSWVTKSKSNCPMDRLDITELRVFDTRGKFLRSVKVEAKDEEPEVDFTFEDDGICPDCGWMGMRATVGVCMHCMYHVEDPVPATNCPQCMENESDPSDEEWVPESARVSSLESRRSRTLRSDTNQHVLLDDEGASFSSNRRRARNSINLEEFIVENDSDESIEFGLSFGGRSSSASNLTEDLAQPGPSTSQAPPRTIRRKVVRKTTAKKRKTTTKKRKVRRKKVVRKKTSTTGGNRRKRKVKRRRTVKRKKKTPSNRPRLPEDSAKKRLAKILGVKAPKYSGQMLPRGCKKQAVTAAQRQALASTSSSSVYNRPVESLDYHNSSVPTLHLFGGPELEYFPSDSDSEGSSSDYDYARKPLPSTSASVIKRYKNNALKSLRKKTVAASVSVSSSAPVNILDSIFESQNKKFEIKSGIDKRLDPYNVTPTSSVISGNSRKVKFNSSDEASSSNNTSRSSSSTYKNFKNSIEDSGRAVNFLNCKKSPSKDDDLDLYGDIPAEGTGNAGADDDDVGDAEDYLFDGGDAGSNTGGDGDGGGGDGDDDDKDKKDVEQPNEEEQEKEDDEEEDDDDETEDISEMVIDESVLADDYEVKDDVEDETKDPLAIAEEPEEVPLAAPSPEIDEKVILPDNLDPVFPIISPIVVASHMLAPPVFRYSETSLQIARHLNLDDENVPTEQEEPEEHPEEPESEPEDSPAQCDESKEQFTAFPYPQMSPPRDQNVVKNERFSPPSLPLSSIKKEEEVASPVLEPPKIITNGIDSGGTKKIARSKSRKRSLVEELFGSDIDDNVPPRKISTDKGSEDGEIRDKKRKSDEETKIQTKKENEVEPEPSAKMSPKRSKRKKEKSRELSNKKKKKERKRSRSRSSSPDRKKKHHSKKHSPSRHSRKRSRSRSRSRKRHEENGRLSVHERLGPKRGRSRDRSSEPSGKKEVFSSGENILVSVNFSRRRKRIAEIAAKRRPVAVINLAVDEDKSPIIEKGDSPKEVIELDEGWGTDDEPVKAKQKETTSKMKEKSLKIKETGPKTPPEPQVKFSIASRPQLKHKNVLGAHDDDDDDEPDQPSELKEAPASKPPIGETYDPFNPTASPNQEAENEPPKAAPSQPQTKISSIPPEGAAPQQRPLSPPKLMTEMPKIERPPVVVPVATTMKPPLEIFPGLPANVANILCSSQLQNVFNPQLTALTVPLLLANPALLNMQNVVQQVSQQAQAAAPSHPKVDNAVVDMDLESPYSPAASEADDLFEPPSKGQTQTTNKPQEKFDVIFGSTNKRAVKTKATPSSSKTSVKEIKTTVVTSAGKKDISIKMDRNNLKVVGELPNPAAETQVKEKFLKKLNRQERVVEEVKVALKPHYTKKLINKEEYKDILRRAVPKVCHNKSGEINPVKIKSLVCEYVKRVRHERKKVKKA